MNECNQREECTHLNDHGCDDQNWRYCVNVDIGFYEDQINPIKSCTLLKPSYGKS